MGLEVAGAPQGIGFPWFPLSQSDGVGGSHSPGGTSDPSGPSLCPLTETCHFNPIAAKRMKLIRARQTLGFSYQHSQGLRAPSQGWGGGGGSDSSVVTMAKHKQ